MKNAVSRLGLILFLALAAFLMGCADSNSSNSIAFPPVTANWKKDVLADDIARIKWLEGTWRGTGGGQEPFYERYKFEGTTLAVESFADGTLEKVTDTTRYALINGEFRYTAEGRRVAASEITDDHIQFVPVVGEGNSYRFERQDEGKWRAVLEWPAAADKPAKQVIYNMEPYKK